LRCQRVSAARRDLRGRALSGDLETIVGADPAGRSAVRSHSHVARCLQCWKHQAGLRSDRPYGCGRPATPTRSPSRRPCARSISARDNADAASDFTRPARPEPSHQVADRWELDDRTAKRVVPAIEGRVGRRSGNLRKSLGCLSRLGSPKSAAACLSAAPPPVGGTLPNTGAGKRDAHATSFALLVLTCRSKRGEQALLLRTAKNQRDLLSGFMKTDAT
jgi:hypothetical protein